MPSPLLARRSSWVVAFALGACAPAPAAEVRSAVPTPRAVDSAAPPTARTPLEEAFNGAVPPACRGGLVDLAKLRECQCQRIQRTVLDGHEAIRASMWCGTEFETEGPPEGVTFELEAKDAVVAAGDQAAIVLRIKNGSTKRAIVRLDSTYLFVRPKQTGECMQGMSEPRNEHLIVLEPRGVAEKTFPWRAATSHGTMSGDAGCTFAPRPLPAGRYTLELTVPTPGSPSVTTLVTVRNVN